VQAAAAAPFYRSYRTGFRERITVTAEPTLASAIRIGDPVSFEPDPIYRENSRR